MLYIILSTYLTILDAYATIQLSFYKNKKQKNINNLSNFDRSAKADSRWRHSQRFLTYRASVRFGDVTDAPP